MKINHISDIQLKIRAKVCELMDLKFKEGKSLSPETEELIIFMRQIDYEITAFLLSEEKNNLL